MPASTQTSCQEQWGRHISVIWICIQINPGKSTNPLPRACLRLDRTGTCCSDEDRALPLLFFWCLCWDGLQLFYLVPTQRWGWFESHDSSSERALNPLPTISSVSGFSNFRWQEPVAEKHFLLSMLSSGTDHCTFPDPSHHPSSPSTPNATSELFRSRQTLSAVSCRAAYGQAPGSRAQVLQERSRCPGGTGRQTSRTLRCPAGLCQHRAGLRFLARGGFVSTQPAWALR